MTDTVATLVKCLGGRTPRVALVLGSELGNLVDQVEDAITDPLFGASRFP